MPAENETHAADAVEQQAVAACQGGDLDAYGRLVALHQDRLFSLALMMVRDHGAAEDITQDALVKGFSLLDRFDSQRPFYPWVATIAVRLAQTWLRRRTRDLAREHSAEDPYEGLAGDNEPEREIVAEQNNERLWEEVARLSQAQRTTVYLYYGQDMKIDDIATALGVSTGTVKTLMYRARKTLRQRLQATAGTDSELEESKS